MLLLLLLLSFGCHARRRSREYHIFAVMKYTSLSHTVPVHLCSLHTSRVRLRPRSRFLNFDVCAIYACIRIFVWPCCTFNFFFFFLFDLLSLSFSSFYVLLATTTYHFIFIFQSLNLIFVGAASVSVRVCVCDVCAFLLFIFPFLNLKKYFHKCQLVKRKSHCSSRTRAHTHTNATFSGIGWPVAHSTLCLMSI